MKRLAKAEKAELQEAFAHKKGYGLLIELLTLLPDLARLIIEMIQAFKASKEKQA